MDLGLANTCGDQRQVGRPPRRARSDRPQPAVLGLISAEEISIARTRLVEAGFDPDAPTGGASLGGIDR
jgi:hypothetical protein